MSATRRSTLGFGVAGLAGILSAGTARAAAPKAADNPDKALIAGCERLIAHHRKIDALMASRLTAADEERTDAALSKLLGRQHQLEHELEAQPPAATFEGAIAMARTLVAVGPKDSQGELFAEDFDQWLGLSIAEFLAG